MTHHPNTPLIKLRRFFSLSFSLAALGLFCGCGDTIKGEAGLEGPAGADGSAKLAVFHNRPTYAPVDGNTKQVQVPASEAVPARVLIADTVLTNTAASVVDLTVTGAGGLDQGSAQASRIYYLYAVPSDESSFALMASLRSPSEGPLNQEHWSYLGAFQTGITGDVLEFSKNADQFMFHYRDLSNAVNLDTALGITYNCWIPLVPLTVDQYLGRSSITANNSGPAYIFYSVNGGLATGRGSIHYDFHHSLNPAPDDPHLTKSIWFVFETAERSLCHAWIHHTAPAAGHMLILGWIEDPTQWP